MTVKLSFKDFMDGNIPRGAWALYVVRDDENTVLYVGITTRHVWDRWFGGFGHIQTNFYGEQWGSSEIGEIIIRHRPQSMKWTIQLFTHSELVKRFKNKLLKVSPTRNLEKVQLAELEDFMITKLKPSTNSKLPHLSGAMNKTKYAGIDKSKIDEAFQRFEDYMKER